MGGQSIIGVTKGDTRSLDYGSSCLGSKIGIQGVRFSDICLVRTNLIPEVKDWGSVFRVWGLGFTVMEQERESLPASLLFIGRVLLCPSVDLASFSLTVTVLKGALLRGCL